MPIFSALLLTIYLYQMYQLTKGFKLWDNFERLGYRYQWLYDLISRLAALSVGGEARFRQLALQG